jgi:hypothetical protein
VHYTPDVRGLIQIGACLAMFGGFLVAARLIRRAEVRRTTPPSPPMIPAPRPASDPELPTTAADSPAVVVVGI